MLQAKLLNAQQVCISHVLVFTVKKFQVDGLVVQSNLLLQQISVKFVF